MSASRPHDDPLAAIRERLNAITPGEWQATIEPDMDDFRVCNIEDGKCIACLALMGDYDHERDVWSEESRTQWVADAEFVAHAPEAIRFLLKHVEALEAAHREQAAALAAIREAAIEHLRVPTNVSRGELAEALGIPHDEASVPGAFKAARGIFTKEEDAPPPSSTDSADTGG